MACRRPHLPHPDARPWRHPSGNQSRRSGRGSRTPCRRAAAHDERSVLGERLPPIGGVQCVIIRAPSFRHGIVTRVRQTGSVVVRFSGGIAMIAVRRYRGVLVLLMAVTAAAATTATASAGTGSSAVIILCTGQHQARPHEVVLSCADANWGVASCTGAASALAAPSGTGLDSQTRASRTARAATSSTFGCGSSRAGFGGHRSASATRDFASMRSGGRRLISLRRRSSASLASAPISPRVQLPLHRRAPVAWGSHRGGGQARDRFRRAHCGRTALPA